MNCSGWRIFLYLIIRTDMVSRKGNSFFGDMMFAVMSYDGITVGLTEVPREKSRKQVTEFKSRFDEMRDVVLPAIV